MADPFKPVKQKPYRKWRLLLPLVVMVALFVGAVIVAWFYSGSPSPPVEPPVQPHMSPLVPGG